MSCYSRHFVKLFNIALELLQKEQAAAFGYVIAGVIRMQPNTQASRVSAAQDSTISWQWPELWRVDQ